MIATALLDGWTWTAILEHKRFSDHPDLDMRSFLIRTGRAHERHPLLVEAIHEAIRAWDDFIPTKDEGGR